MTAYDRVPYRSHPYLMAHPDHLAAVATLHGLDPAPIDAARILEIGCSSGGHLLPMAASLPGATFVGVDPARTAIEAGRARVAELGLRNVELLALGVESLPEGEPFDYVVAHGVLSWVPPDVREVLWRVIGRRLSPRGVAYLSFNANPGWAMRGALCHMMRWHVRDLGEPSLRVAAARELLEVLCASTAATSEWGAMLHAERKRIAGLEDWYLLHDHLAEHNHPFWFHEVDDTARSHGLRFLAEAEPWRRNPATLAEPARTTFSALARDQVELEQYLDMARMSVFRETLWVPAAAPVEAAVDPERVRSLSFTLRARRTDPEGRRYQTPEGTVVTATDPLARALMAALGDGTRAWSFDALAARVGSDVGGPELDEHHLAANLLALVVGHGVVRLHRWPRAWLATLTARPVVFASARAQAAAGDARVTNLGHEGVPTDRFDRAVLARLDGEHDRDGLTDALLGLVRRGELDVGPVGEEPDPVVAAVERRMLDTLLRVARSALLVG